MPPKVVVLLLVVTISRGGDTSMAESSDVDSQVVMRG